MDIKGKSIKSTLLLISFAGLVLYVASNTQTVFGTVFTWVGYLTPMIIGLALAFIINIPMRGIEKLLFGNKFAVKRSWLQKMKRPVSLVLALLAFCLVVNIVLFLLIPELAKTAEIIIVNIQIFIENFENIEQSLYGSFAFIGEALASLNIDWKAMVDGVIEFLQVGVTGIVSSTFSFATGLVDTFIGFIFALYVLSQKEKLSRQCKKLLRACVSTQKSDWVIKIFKMANVTFSKFLTIQCTEGLIIGVMFFIAMSIFQMEYALLISVLIAVLALIPIFGAFIGCAMGAFLILVVDPMQAVWFIVMFLVIQQLEGNIIYPRVVGTSVGLSSIWVLSAVTIGGSAMGVIGMLIGVPLASITFALLKEIVNNKLDKKQAKIDALISLQEETTEQIGIPEKTE